MKLLKAELNNFASYDNLEYSFHNQGLTLIHGATGAGKSTLQDAPAWILFGVTAKDGNADDIRSWTHPDDPTSGTLTLESKDGVNLTVVRTRGKPSQNDLYWLEGDSEEKHRGKDITETQKLLEGRLGVSKDLYVAGAYYNEFSPTGAFFTSKAKDRRELFEKLADLDLPVLIAEGAANGKKETRKALSQASEELNKASGRLEQLRSSEKAAERDAQRWEENQERIVKELKDKEQNFDKEKEEKLSKLLKDEEVFSVNKHLQLSDYMDKIDALKLRLSEISGVCLECGQPNASFIQLERDLIKLQSKLEQIASQVYPSSHLIQLTKDSTNPYTAKLQQMEVNPFLEQLARFTKEIVKVGEKVNSLRITQDELSTKYSALTRLYDLSFILRGELLKKAVKSVEEQTNLYLETYFDSEMRVSFNIEDSDNLDVAITKNGYSCVFRQLSKGQRGLLKLCFSISVMKAAANKSGVHFNTLLFDEALDGLDSSLKLKAFNLFSELEKDHETILVIDHNSDLQTLFNKRYCVTLINDRSEIHED